MSAPSTPKINDDYWFGWSKQYIDDALERRNAAFSKLQNLVVWLWGIYTTFAAVGFALSSKALEPVTVIAISAASVLLIMVYWACVWGQMTIPVEFDPRSPTEIRDAHYNLVKKKDDRLKITTGLSLLAAASVAVALLVAGGSRGGDSPYLDVATRGPSQGQVDLAVTARVKPETTATVEVYSSPGSGQPQRQIQTMFLSSDAGMVQTSLALPAADAYQIRITWQDGDTERSMTTVTEAVDNPSE